jgi:hypothetical protein
VRLVAQQVAAGHKADDLPLLHEGHVMDAQFEHHQHSPVDGGVGVERAQGAAHYRGHGGLRPQPRSDDAAPEVAVGEDAGRVAAHEDRRDVGLAHELRRLLHRRTRVYEDRAAGNKPVQRYRQSPLRHFIHQPGAP